MTIMKKPSWLRIKPPNEKCVQKMKALIDGLNIRTVCDSCLCPNIGTCFAEGTATFLILGDICTRNCRFCSVKHGKPLPPDLKEPERIVEAAKKLKLEHIVLTCVTRDDLPDGGASLFAKTLKRINCLIPNATTEVLISDLGGLKKNLHTIIEAKPDILAHNLEVVSKLHEKIRPQANYLRSLSILEHTKKRNPEIITKSSIMVGLGEKRKEITETMQHLREVDCDIFTVGQYMRPTLENVEVKEYIHPEVFNEYKNEGYNMGFKYITSGPFVRSSFHAKQILKSIQEEIG